MRISDWSSDVCSSDLQLLAELLGGLIGLQLDQLERRIVIALEEGFGAPLGGDRLDGEGRARLPVDHTRQTPDIEIRARRIGFVEGRSDEHPSELQSLMRISYAVFCLKKNNNN